MLFGFGSRCILVFVFVIVVVLVLVIVILLFFCGGHVNIISVTVDDARSTKVNSIGTAFGFRQK